MKNIVITGGSKGMGKAIAEKFASFNNNIFICSRNEAELAATADELQKKYKINIENKDDDFLKNKITEMYANTLINHLSAQD